MDTDEHFYERTGPGPEVTFESETCGAPSID